MLGAGFVISGIISTIIFPCLIQKFQWYLRSLRIVAFGAFVSGLAVCFSLPTRSFYISLSSISLLGFFLIPALSIIYAFCTELTFPVSPCLFGCVLQGGSSIFGAIVTYAAPVVISNLNSEFVISFYALMMLVCVVLSVFIKEDLRRLNLNKS